MTVYPRLFLLFIIYSFFGWCSEVLYVGIFVEHKFVNRGFLHGPICPIYGFGGLIVMYGLRNWNGSWIGLFFASAFFCSVLEYLTSWILETLFQTKWWDYSDQKFNLNGRICLLNSFLFGIMGVLCTYYVQPLLVSLVMLLSDNTAEWTADAVLAALVTDFLITLRRLVAFSTTLGKFKEFTESLQERFSTDTWFKNSSIAEMFASIKKQAESHRGQFSQTLLDKVESFSSHQRNAESFLRRFPTMTSSIYKLPLAHFKTRLAEEVAEKKALAKARHDSRKNR